MPTKVPQIIKTQVIQQWLAGDTRDKIATDNGLSSGTVTNIVDEWRRALGFSSADQLRDLGITLKKIGLTPAQCATGFRVAMLMCRIGVKEDDIQIFITEVYNHCKTLGITPENIASHLIDFLELSKKVPVSQISDYIQQKIDEKNNLEQEVERLDTRKSTLLSKISELEAVHTASLEEKKITDEVITWYSNLKSELGEDGIDIDDVTQLTKAIKGAKELGYDPFRVTTEILNLDVLRSQYQYYQSWVPIVQGQYYNLKQNCSFLEQTIQSHNQTLSTFAELTAMGLGLKELKILWHTISEISGANYIPLDNAVQKFLKEIEDNYDDVLGFKSKVENLRYETDKLTQQINFLRIQLSLYPSVGTVLPNLIQKGVKEEEIIAFAELLGEKSIHMNNISSLNGRSLIDDVRQYGDIKSAINRMTQQYDNLRIELSLLGTQNRQLYSDNQNLTLRLENLKKIVDFFSGSIHSLATEIIRLFSVIAYANMFLLKTHYVEPYENGNESKIDIFTPLIKSARGEAVPLSELKKAVSKAIEVLLVNIKGNDTERFKTLSDALLLLENEG